MPRGSVLRKRREAAGLRQADVARHIERADGSGRPIDDTLLSRIEAEQVRLPRGFSRQFMAALEAAQRERSMLASVVERNGAQER